MGGPVTEVMVDGFSDALSTNEEQQLRRLLVEIAKNDSEAFENLYQATVQPIYRYLRSQIQDEECIRDLLQEVYLSVWRKADSFQGTSRVMTWLIGIARHKLQDALRIASRIGKQETQWEEIECASTDDFSLGVVRTVDMSRHLAVLSKADKELTHLVFVQQLPLREVATLLGVPEGTVKSRVFHLKSKLRQALGTIKTKENPT